jgi:site-specific recombinase XerD
MVPPNGNVTINKKMSNFGQVFIYALQNNWIQSNPISQWKLLPEPKTNTEYLTEIQLLKFMEFRIPNDTHEIVKDTFLFMCLTGMGFSEMQRFSFSQIKEIEEESIIEYERSKAKIKKTIQIPLLPMAMKLITKNYMKPIKKGKRSFVDKGPKDPVFSVQGMKIYNEKIKYLFSFNEMDLDFIVSSHAARKTFGNLMTKKLGLTDASQLLGHSEIKTTTKNYVDNASNDLLMQRLLKMRNIFGKNHDDN